MKGKAALILKENSTLAEAVKKVKVLKSSLLEGERVVSSFLKFSNIMDVTLDDLLEVEEEKGCSTNNLKNITMRKATKLAQEIIKEKGSVKSTPEMLEEFEKRGVTIFQSSLKDVLTKNKHIFYFDHEERVWSLKER